MSPGREERPGVGTEALNKSLAGDYNNCNAPSVSIELVVPVVVRGFHADLRAASLTRAPLGSRVRIETGEARYFDDVDVPLIAEAMRAARTVAITGTDADLVMRLQSALNAQWQVIAR